MVKGVRWGLLGGLLLLSACGYNLDSRKIEADIKADIERQGWRVTLNKVICPDGVAKQADAYFRCVGELASGEVFTVNVIQQDDVGTVAWDVPSSKTLINLVSLETEMQAELSKVISQRVVVSCDGAYRVNARGDSFECDVVGLVTAGTERIDSVLVKIGPEGDLNWQEVRIPADNGSLALPNPAAAPPEGGAVAANPAPASAEASAAPATNTPASDGGNGDDD
ncbi:MAG: DUF4333 domain-containing protein [Cyanobacteria bacterium P01_A01_bin.105]